MDPPRLALTRSDDGRTVDNGGRNRARFGVWGSLLLVFLLGVAHALGAAQRPGTGPSASPTATYTNPVYDHDFPDPFILPYDGRFYAFATHTASFGFQVMESPDMVHWTHRGTAFTPPWSRENLWAPEVIRYRGRFHMTYSARSLQTRRHDVGIATADAPLGPYTDRAVLVRGDADRRGIIDATVFLDRDGSPYLFYVIEGPNRIVMQRLRPDLLAVEGPVTEIVHPDRPWERGINEAPTLLLRNGVYHLFFSVGWYQSNKQDACYCVCHATARSPYGSYVKDPEPLLKTVPGKVYGPGHQCVVTLPGGETWIAYHAWDDRGEPRYGANPAGRTLRIDRLDWRGDTPVIAGPTVTPQPAPRVAPERRSGAGRTGFRDLRTWGTWYDDTLLWAGQRVDRRTALPSGLLRALRP